MFSSYIEGGKEFHFLKLALAGSLGDKLWGQGGTELVRMVEKTRPFLSSGGKLVIVCFYPATSASACLWYHEEQGIPPGYAQGRLLLQLLGKEEQDNDLACYWGTNACIDRRFCTFLRSS